MEEFLSKGYRCCSTANSTAKMFLSTGGAVHRTTASHFQFKPVASQKLSLKNGAIDPTYAKLALACATYKTAANPSDATYVSQGQGGEKKQLQVSKALKD